MVYWHARVWTDGTVFFTSLLSGLDIVLITNRVATNTWDWLEFYIYRCLLVSYIHCGENRVPHTYLKWNRAAKFILHIMWIYEYENQPSYLFTFWSLMMRSRRQKWVYNKYVSSVHCTVGAATCQRVHSGACAMIIVNYVFHCWVFLHQVRS